MTCRLLSFLFALFTLFATSQAAPPPPQEKFLSANGAEFFCRIFGKGGPIIVIHGAPGLSQDYLLPYLASLSENNLVVFYDQRGCGQTISELTEKQINVSTFVEDIESIRKSLNYDKITLLGHSWGGFLAMKYALQYPASTHKLILLDTMPASQEEFTLFIEEVTKRLAPLHDALQTIESTDLYKAGDPETVEKQLKMVFQTYLYNPENIKKLNFCLPQQGILNGFKAFGLLCETIFMKPYDIFNDLPAIKCPTLILHGDSDPISYRMAEHIQQAIPNSQFIKIDNCGHFPYVEQPQITFSAIKNFLEKSAH